MSKYSIEVVSVVGGTVTSDKYECSHASINMRTEVSPHATVIAFRDGQDAEGPVNAVLYHKVERIIKRPCEL